MERSIFRFIWSNSKRQQIIALLLTFVSFPFLYYSLDLPKTIIDKAIEPAPEGVENPGSQFVDIEAFGLNFTDFFGVQLPQITYLFLLCGLFLALVVVNGMFKMRINTFKGIMAERLLRRLRFTLLARTLRFPLPQFQKTSSGEIVTMVTAEVEPLGGFFGDAFALVAFQGGTFLTIVSFMFIQDWRIGVAATALVPLQAYIVPKLQRKVNLLGKERVRRVRDLSNRVGEVSAGVEDVRANDNSSHVLADISKRLGGIFVVRFEIYQRKFFMKFVNNFINQMTPFLFFSIGGVLVINGSLTEGALVAALAAYKDLAAPWKELLNYYQRLADSKIKYEQLIGQFAPPGMLDERLQEGRPETLPHLDGPIRATALSWADEDGVKTIDSASFELDAGSTVAVVSASGTAKEVFARLLARLLEPTSGKLRFGESEAASLHEGVIGARLGYAPPNPAFFNGTIAANMFIGLQRSPPDPKAEREEAERRDEIEEALAAGNSPYNPDLDWTDYALAGVQDRAELTERAIDLLGATEMEEEMYALGLRQTIDPEAEPQLAEAVMTARGLIRNHLDAHGLDDLVQTYDFDRYNTYSSVAGNILFGKPVTEEWQYENLPENPKLAALLERHGLTEDFFRIGLKCAELMVELFQDLPSGHPFFEQYSFVDEDLLPELKIIARKAKQEGDAGAITEEERRIVSSLPFNLMTQRHRLGLIDSAMEERLIQVRKDLRTDYPEVFEPGGGIESFDPDRYNPGLSILDNILFGRIVHGRSDATERVMAVVGEITDELDLRRAIVRAAFHFPVGINGGRLSSAQRQKLNLVRCAIKNPDVLVVADAMSAIDAEAQARIARNLREELPRATLIWIASSTQEGLHFDKVLEIKSGRIVEGEVGKAAEAPQEAAAVEETPAAKADESALSGEAQSLQQVPLFANLDPSRLKFLAFTSERKTYEPGEHLITEDEDGEAAYVILDGTAEVVIGHDKTEKVLFELGRNRLVGELALLNDAKRTATVRAKTAVTALMLRREVFSEMARQDSFFAFEMTRDMGRRLIMTTDELSKTRDELARLKDS